MKYRKAGIQESGVRIRNEHLPTPCFCIRTSAFRILKRYISLFYMEILNSHRKTP